jgi:plasmid stabilization system protein ParE
MSFVVRPTAAALDDAVRIAKRIRDAGYPDNADRWFAALMDAMNGLAEFPMRCARRRRSGRH